MEIVTLAYKYAIMEGMNKGQKNPHNPEWNKRISESKKGMPSSFKGKKHSEEAKEKLSKAAKNRSPETLRKMSLAQVGKKHSEERNREQSLRMMGHLVSEDTRKKMRESARRGEYNPSWKGGITPKNEMVRSSLDYKKWRKAVFERDNHTCCLCGDSNYIGRGATLILNADHIKPFYLFPELRFELSNGRTLCITCHKETDTWGRPKII